MINKKLREWKNGWLIGRVAPLWWSFSFHASLNMRRQLRGERTYHRSPRTAFPISHESPCLQRFTCYRDTYYRKFERTCRDSKESLSVRCTSAWEYCAIAVHLGVTYGYIYWKIENSLRTWSKSPAWNARVIDLPEENSRGSSVSPTRDRYFKNHSLPIYV